MQSLHLGKSPLQSNDQRTNYGSKWLGRSRNLWQLPRVPVSVQNLLPPILFDADSGPTLTPYLRHLLSVQTSLNCAHRVLFARCIQFLLPPTVKLTLVLASSSAPSSCADPSLPNSEELPEV